MRAIRLATALVAAVLTVGSALPAQADVAGTMAKIGAERQTQLVRTACERSFAAARCGSQQTKLIKAVANQASAQVSPREIGSRQLQVLIDSVN